MIVNPIAGDVDKTIIVETAKAFAEKEEVNLILFETTAGDDNAEIKSLFDKHLPERVLIAGGDGTIKMVAEALEKQLEQKIAQLT